MSRMEPVGTLRQRQPSKRFTPEERKFNRWLHNGGECCLTAQPVFDIAHTGDKAMAMKAPLDTCLPLIRGLHMIEERARARFWEQVGVPDYLDWAKMLFASFEDGCDPMDVISEIQRQADREIIADMLTDPNQF